MLTTQYLSNDVDLDQKKECEAYFKVEYGKEVKTEIDTYKQEYFENVPKVFVEPSQHTIDYNYRDDGDDSVLVEYSILGTKGREVKMEKYVKIEIDYEEKCNKIVPEHRSETVSLDYSQTDIEDDGNFKVKFEDIDIYKEGSDDAPHEEFLKHEENLQPIFSYGIENTAEHKEKSRNQTEKKFNCETCQYSTNYSSALKRHKRRHDKVSMFICNICQKQHNEAPQLKRHMFLHLKEAQTIHKLNSVEIGKNLGDRSRIMAEIKGKEYELEIFKCRGCDYTTSHSSSFQYHVKGVHLNKKEFKCDFCEFSSAQMSNMRTHIKRYHRLLEELSECHLCHDSANQKTSLVNHLSCEHVDERKFECNLCPFKAHRKSGLNKHMSSVHLQNLEFECQYCDYKGTQKSHIDQHMSSVHLKERKFECNLCKYRANLKSNLNNHLNSVHLNERKFECHLCKYKANRKSHLEKHLSSIHLKHN